VVWTRRDSSCYPKHYLIAISQCHGGRSAPLRSVTSAFCFLVFYTTITSAVGLSVSLRTKHAITRRVREQQSQKNARLSCPRQLSRMRASNCVKRLGSPPLCPRFTVLLAQAILYLCRILYRVRLCPSPRTRRVCSLRRCDANHGLPVLDFFFDMPAWGHPKNKVDRPSSLTTRHR
jgi:hypothetical protein